MEVSQAGIILPYSLFRISYFLIGYCDFMFLIKFFRPIPGGQTPH